jgi:hypothetical protein
VGVLARRHPALRRDPDLPARLGERPPGAVRPDGADVNLLWVLAVVGIVLLVLLMAGELHV